jgi:hypothetical protein
MSINFVIEYKGDAGLTYDLTNSLGSCMGPCTQYTVTPMDMNIYDISWKSGVALGDVLALNPWYNPVVGFQVGQVRCASWFWNCANVRFAMPKYD